MLHLTPKEGISLFSATASDRELRKDRVHIYEGRIGGARDILLEEK